ncbi:MAG: dienelactone hydrolase family protein [Pseudomonadota bacterium]
MTIFRQIRILPAVAAVLITACGSEDAPPPAVVAAAPAPAVEATPAPSDEADVRKGTGSMLAYAEVDGMLARGYLAYPVDMTEPLPAVMLIHDWFGLDDEIKKLSDTLAAQGFVVLAVDLFDGRTGTLPKDTRDALVKILEKPDLTRSNLDQAITFVRETVGSPRLSLLGFGSGGLWALNTALTKPDEFEALVLVQGQTLTDKERLETLNMPLLGIYGANDRSITQEEVRAFGEALKEADVTHEIRLYPVAGNAFMLPSSRSYSPKQSAAAWELVYEFLGENLASPAREAR